MSEISRLEGVRSGTVPHKSSSDSSSPTALCFNSLLLRHGLSRGTLVGETGSGVEAAATSLPLPFFFSFLFFLLEPEKPPVKARVRLRD